MLLYEDDYFDALPEPTAEDLYGPTGRPEPAERDDDNACPECPTGAVEYWYREGDTGYNVYGCGTCGYNE